MLWINGGHGRLADAPPLILYRDGKTRIFDDIPVAWELSFVHATRHLIDAFESGDPPRLTGADGRDILRFLLAAQRSAREGQAASV